MAREQESFVGGIGAADDTRQDPPFKAFTEADSFDSGRERNDDTRRDPAAKSEPVNLCGRWVRMGDDTRHDRNCPSSGLG